jgi:hypothetical protein
MPSSAPLETTAVVTKLISRESIIASPANMNDSRFNAAMRIPHRAILHFGASGGGAFCASTPLTVN